jgi:hypothetical protein
VLVATSTPDASSGWTRTIGRTISPRLSCARASAPRWNIWRTPVSLSAILLGLLVLLAVSDSLDSSPLPAFRMASHALHTPWFVVVAAALAAQQVVGRWRFYRRLAEKVM